MRPLPTPQNHPHQQLRIELLNIQRRQRLMAF
jgi:hypothetical protein